MSYATLLILSHEFAVTLRIIYHGYRLLDNFLLPGYGTYTWAKSYDEWQNSKAAHVAGHGAH